MSTQKAGRALIISGIILMALFGVALAIDPIGNIVFSITFGSCYHKRGEISVQIGEKTETLSIYTKKDKPFLLLGPYHFGNDYYDYFFVNREQVIRTATDKGGDAWVRLGNCLFILDDLSSADRFLRAPYWDDLQDDDQATVKYDGLAGIWRYSFRINDLTLPVSFSLPAELLSEAMCTAPNVTKETYRK